MKKPQSKWFYAFAGVALALVCAIVAIVVICLLPKSPAGQPTPGVPEIPADGPETGIYYYDVAGSEILLSLNSGNKFTIAGTDINKSGDYTVNGEDITLDFVRDEDRTASAKYNGDTIVLTYKDATMTFLKKVYYSVSFNTADGSAMDPVSILNGKTVAEPASPEKDNCVFLGWYTDAELTTPFAFDSTAITSDLTLYAKWAEKIAGVKNFVATLDLNYEGAPEATKLISVSGKLYDVPSPEREGYTFEGWFISIYEDSEKLSYEYSEDLVLTADTTLFAVWSEDNSEKLASPAVSVTENSLKWNSVIGASRYEITITHPDGSVTTVTEGGTSYTFDFAAADLGEYVFKVVAIASTDANNSEAAVRYYVNKALPKVNSFLVIDNVLIFNDVEGAEKYYITVDCGNKAHNHAFFDNGTSTSFNFANCPMQKGGIVFTVVASASGYANSVPSIFVYDRTLSAVTGITYSAETDSFVWDAVDFAAGYTVTVTAGNETYTFNIGNKTSFSTAAYTGDVKIAVTPVTKGYNSPAPSEASCTKTIPAAPSNISVSGNVISWTAIEGATYEIMLNGKSYTADTNSFDLTNSGLATNLVYKVSVKAIKDGLSSSYSEETSVAYLAMDPVLTYFGNTVYWSPVIGANNFEVRVNGAPAKSYSGVTSARVTLTKAGSNLIEVRYTDNGGSEWVSITVNAFEIIYMSRSMSGEKTEYVAIGDTLTPPESFTNEGYYFSGWYNTPATAAGNGTKYEDFTFLGNEATVLYADWTPNTYKIEFNTEGFGITNIADGDTADAVYTKDYTLPVPTSDNATYNVFIGWYTGPSGSGVKLTDEYGRSVAPFPYTHNVVAHPYYNADILSFELRDDNTYAVSAGVNFDSVSHVYIPHTYNDLPVTVIVENAFKSRTNLVTINIPNTIKVIGVGAFTSTGQLQAINVYEVEGNHVPNFSSHDGALIRHDMGTTYLEAFPRAKTGTYTMPDGVDVIRNKAFQYANISKVIISKDVTLIQDSAFYACSKLTSIEFASGKTSDVTMSAKMFDRTLGITSIKFPASIASIDISILQGQTNLTSIEVEKGGRFYSSVNGMLTNSIGDTIIYAPNTVSGVYTIPDAINYIGEGAFNGRNGITELIIPTNVLEIGKSAFANCLNLKKITFVGKRVEDIYVGNSAFSGCKLLTEITFGGTGSETDVNKGAVSFGSNVFTPYRANGSAVSEPSIQKVTFENGTFIRALGDYTFADQTTLVSLTFGKNIVIENIGKYAFKGVTSLKTIEIPASTKSIGDGAFQGCTNATSVKFAEGGNEITFGESVFANCTGITKIELPASTKTFNGSAFTGCSSLSEVIVSSSNPYLMAKDGILYGIDANRNPVSIIFFPKTIVADAATINSLPWSTITKIGDSVFEGVTTLTEFKITSKITEIGVGAFSGCTALKTVTCDDGIASFTLGSKAFFGCNKLTSVQLPSNTTAIGSSAFEGCTSLSSFTMPSEVTAIEAKAFLNTGIPSITIPAKVTSIGANAFQSCYALKSVIFENGADITLEDGVFVSCAVLNNVSFNGRVKILPSKTFYSNIGLTNIDLTGITTIGKSALSCCFALVSIDIPNTVTLIDDSAFESNSKLTTVNFLPGGNADLDFGILVFKGAVALESFTFPKRTGKIYDYGYYSNGSANNGGKEDTSQKFQTKNFFLMFSGTTKLKNIYVEAGCTSLVSINGILYEINKDGVPFVLLYCPVANEGVNGVVTVPNTVTKVENLSFYGVTKITEINFENFPTDHIYFGKPVLSIGNGMAEDVANGSEVFRSSSIKTISFPSHLGSIGPKALTLSASKLSITFHPSSTGVSIGNNAFSNCSGISSLTLYGIDYLASGAFSWVNGLSSISFQNSTFQAIYQNAFAKTAISSLVIPASVKVIGQGAFCNTASLRYISFEAGSNLTKLESYLFQTQYVNTNVSSIRNFDLSNATKLTTIEAYAFKCCGGLTSFTLPSSVTSMGEHVFEKCTNITSLTLNANCTVDMLFKNNHEGYVSLLSDLTALSSLSMNGEGRQLAVVDGVLYDKAQTIIYSFPAKKNPAGYVMPRTVTTIAAGAFTGFTGTTFTFHEGIEVIGEKAFQNSAIQTIVLPSTIRTIDKDAFSNCKATYLSFAEGCKLTVIPERAFYQMSSLRTLILPDNVKKIEAGAFQNCSKLESLILPAALEEIGDHAFTNALFITEITFQQNLKTIGNNAFALMLRLKSLTIPASVEYIGDSAFESFGSFGPDAATVTFDAGSKLTYIGANAFNKLSNTLSVQIPTGVTSIGENAFANMTMLETLTIPETVNTIGAGAFRNNIALKSVTLPAAIAEIPADLFNGCTALETVNIPEKVTDIGENAFAGTSVKAIMIPKNVVSVGDSAFENCTSLTEVIFDSENKLTALGNNVFKNTTSLVTVELPLGIEELGVSIFENSSVKNITLPSSLKTIGDYAFANCDNVESFEIYGNVTSIGAYAFFDCDKLAVTSLSFGVETIGDFAFRSCDMLTDAYIPATVSTLGANPFFECPLVTEITVDKDNTMFIVDGNGAIYGADNRVLYYYPASATAEEVILPATLNEIKMGAFINNAYIKSIFIPRNVSAINDFTFQNCVNLTTVTIEDGSVLKLIGTHAFDGCEKLATITLPGTLSTIGDYAFYNCKSLDNVTIPASATTLGNYVFSGCSSLAEVSFAPNTAMSPYVIGTHFFENCSSLTEVVLPLHFYITNEDAEKYNLTSARGGIIPSYMFAGTGIVNAVIPSSVTKLDSEGVFMNCKALKDINFGTHTYNYTKLGDHLFDGCESLTIVRLPKGGATTIGNHSFANCTSLLAVMLYFHTEPTSGGEYMFYNCTSLMQVVWEKTENYNSFDYTKGIRYMKYVAPYFFAGCTSLPAFQVASGATISNNAFDGCASLASLTVEGTQTIASIGDEAFKGCTGFKTFNVAFPLPSVVGARVFEGWTAEQTIRFTQDLKLSISHLMAKGMFEGCKATVLDKNGENIELN